MGLGAVEVGVVQYLEVGVADEDIALSHRHRAFSLPPLAKVLPSGDQARPHTCRYRVIRRDIGLRGGGGKGGVCE